jgi:hypothetical protein
MRCPLTDFMVYSDSPFYLPFAEHWELAPSGTKRHGFGHLLLSGQGYHDLLYQ